MSRSFTVIRAAAIICTVLAACVASSVTASELPQPADDVDSRIERLLDQMTLEEKSALLHGETKFSTRGVPRLGIPPLTFTDGPHGVRREIMPYEWKSAGWPDDYATYLPTGSALASTWNPDLAVEYGAVLGAEARHRGKDVLLGPAINIVRTPLNGRTFEYLGEDPHLAGTIASAVVRGIQSHGVAACSKHYVANNQDWDRTNSDVIADERALREIYLRAFEMTVDAGVLCVMAGYNRIDGIEMSEHAEMLRDVLKDEFGFEGFVVSDWSAVNDGVASALGGLDVEMGTKTPYNEHHFADGLIAAVRDGRVPERVIDDMARRVLRVQERIGALDGERIPGTRNTRAHQDVARRVAEEAIVLLKNDGVLPLDPNGVFRIAVIGENADAMHGSGGGSSAVKTPFEVTPLEGLRRRLGDTAELVYVPAYELDRRSDDQLQPIPPSVLLTTDPASGEPGWRGEYFARSDLRGTPETVRYEPTVWFDWGASGDQHDDTPDGIETDRFSARWTATIRPHTTGGHLFALYSEQGSRLLIDGEEVINNWGNRQPQRRELEIELSSDRAYEFVVEYMRPGRSAVVELGWRPPGASRIDTEAEFADAIEAARSSDVAIVVVGRNHDYDDENGDMDHLRLPQHQDHLIDHVTAANPNTIVVVVAGGPVEMPWLDRTPAALYLWYNGMHAGTALADVLFGDVNPSGRLPMSFPVKLEQSPIHAMDLYTHGTAHYTDGVLVGYRWFDTVGHAPLLPFGHGLSYTEFSYSGAEVIEPTDGSALVSVELTVTNEGSVGGAEVVQLYMHDAEASIDRPEQELQAFAKLWLDPGESRRVRLDLSLRALAFWDEEHDRWHAEPGVFELRLGASSRDIRARLRWGYPDLGARTQDHTDTTDSPGG
ncbi:MAG: glycoside hydrolase family 3 C-terminal domain-containing protein [Planctomycetota bacterium]